MLDAGLRKAEADAVTATEATAAAAVGGLRAKRMTIHEQTEAEQAVRKTAMQPRVIEAFRRAAPEGGLRTLDLVGARNA